MVSANDSRTRQRHKAMKVKYKSYGGNHGSYEKVYGTYHQAEGPPSWIAHVENNAPSMSEKLWKKREKLNIAEKRIFDAIIVLPPIDKRESVSKIAEYLNLSKGQVNIHRNTISDLFEPEDFMEAA